MTDAKIQPVLVEVRVPADAENAVGAEVLLRLSVPTLDVDREYAVAVPPPPDLAPSLEASGERIVVIRGTIAGDYIEQLAAQSQVIKVSRDTPIEPFF